MVRCAKVSPDCPAMPVPDESVLDDGYRLADDWEAPPAACKEPDRDVDQTVAVHAAEGSPRSLAGIPKPDPVAVKSRRKRRGRAGSSGGRTRQITVALPFGEWRLLRDEAARQRVSMAELCRRWFGPHFERLAGEAVGDENDGESAAGVVSSKSPVVSDRVGDQ